MAEVFVGIGSNIDREAHIRAGIDALRREFGGLVLSSVYESAAVGFEGENFYNLVAALVTSREPAEVQDVLHGIEAGFGRRRDEPRFAPRTLDLDLLLYDQLVVQEENLVLPREDVDRYAFVLRPLAEIAGERRHPVKGRSFSELWAAFDSSGQETWPVSLDF